MTVSTVEYSAHRSGKPAYRKLDSAHRSPMPWPRKIAIATTLSVPQIELAPVFRDIEAKWWEFQKRYTITMRGHRVDDEFRTLRFYTRRARDRAMYRYLAAHRRVYGWLFAAGQPALGVEACTS